jgi:hypothetical protein
MPNRAVTKGPDIAEKLAVVRGDRCIVVLRRHVEQLLDCANRISPCVKLTSAQHCQFRRTDPAWPFRQLSTPAEVAFAVFAVRGVSLLCAAKATIH